MRTYEETVSQYLTQIQNITESDKEHTHRGALETLINNLKVELDFKDIEIIHEPNNNKNGLGAPDFLILKDSLPQGLIENKRVNANLDQILKSEQIAKYAKLSTNIMLSDYLNFTLLNVENDSIKAEKNVSICSLNELRNLKNIDLKTKSKDLKELFSVFFGATPSPINSAKDFAIKLSQPTKWLENSLIDLQDNEEIHSFYKEFTKGIYENISFNDFADSFAQTLTYSLFLAKFQKDTNPNLNANPDYNPKAEITIYNLASFIGKNFSLINATAKRLQAIYEITGLKRTIDLIVRLINHIDIKMILEDFNRYNKNNHTDEASHNPTIHFYEHFIKEYNPSLRKSRGVYYTPDSVVRFIIDAIDSTLKNDLGFSGGLCDAISKDNKINLLDFATGTGTFILEAFNKALSAIPKNSTKFDPDALLGKFEGFEIMISPYVIAHLNLAITLKDKFDFSLKEDERFNIFLTNTLEKNSGEQATLFQAKKEAEAAHHTKEKQILIITGNPPYSGASQNGELYNDEVKEGYKTLMEDPKNPTAIIKNNKVEREKNPKWLLDDYVKFIRFAQNKIDSQNQGIFAFISNNAFLDNPTFRGMRYSLLTSFDKIYILDLHGNTRKKEIAPDGSKDDNVFDIMQGVSINIFVKTAHKSSTPPPETPHNRDFAPLAKIFHYDLYGKRQHKYNFLASNTLDSITWQALNPTAPFYLFIPQNESLKAEYDKGWSVNNMFRVSNTGIVTKRDNLCIQKTRDKVWEAMQDIINLEKNDFYQKYNMPEDVRDWRYKWAKNDVLENNSKDRIQKILYRPFDTRYIFYSGKSRGFVGWPVPVVSEHFLQNPNNDLLDSKDTNNTGNAKSSTKNSLFKEDDIFKGQARIENFTPEFRAFVDKKYGEHFSPEVILGYIYAVLYHRDYREKYLDFLKMDFPKIVFVESKEKFLKLSELGCKLINLHTMNATNPDGGGGFNEYSACNLPTSQRKPNLSTRIYGTHHNGDVPHLKQGHRGELYVSPLSLQHRASEENTIKNIGLICDRGCKLPQVNNFFISKNTIDYHLVGSASYIFPLYIYNKDYYGK
ncbi:type ISP restriction/modification enzyme [Helicobacter sp. 11S02596-1]|uniref:type ISP restriction/modification enzyme n=1 Tax=Helicobacter sp. 11S02596-1 TaxID=1476194 RepID=UPI000BA6D341|nr:type ISP restriction/modification enzyme [Helicobacter sp. 11S02596-1]PAF42447.1 hypothetical protein BJI48_06450 [Helicobacter sp. 11S02596-1]